MATKSLSRKGFIVIGGHSFVKRPFFTTRYVFLHPEKIFVTQVYYFQAIKFSKSKLTR
jgi:hypothetical protein